MTNNAPSVSGLLTDTKTALDSLAISLDFVAHGVREYHPGAYWLIISLSDQCCDLVERLNKFIADDKPGLSEITFAVSTEEAALIDQFAEKWDCTRDVAATQLAKEALHRMTDELTYPRKN